MLTSPPHCRELPIEHRRRTAPVGIFLLGLSSNSHNGPGGQHHDNPRHGLLEHGHVYYQRWIWAASPWPGSDEGWNGQLLDYDALWFFHFMQVGILLAMTLTTMFFGMVPLIIISQLRNNLDRTSRSRCPLLTITVLFFCSVVNFQLIHLHCCPLIIDFSLQDV